MLTPALLVKPLSIRAADDLIKEKHFVHPSSKYLRRIISH